MSISVGKDGGAGAAERDGRRQAGAATRARLLEAAADLLAEEGPKGVTVRAVSRAAETNVAAVKYHFGSRDGLIAAVVAAATEPVIAAQRERLARLEQADRTPAPGEWIEAWGRPLVRAAIDESDFGVRLGRLVGQALAEPLSPLEEAVRQVVGETDERLIDGLKRAMPGMPEATLRLRLALMASGISGIAGGSFGPHLSHAQPGNRLEDRLVALLVKVGTDPEVEPGVGD